MATTGNQRGISERIAQVVCLKFEFESALHDIITDASLPEIEQVRKIITQSSEMLNGCLLNLQKRQDTLSATQLPTTARLCADFATKITLNGGAGDAASSIKSIPAPVPKPQKTASPTPPPPPKISPPKAPKPQNAPAPVLSKKQLRAQQFAQAPGHKSKVFQAKVAKQPVIHKATHKKADWEFKAYFPEIPATITEEHLRSFFMLYGLVVNVSIFSRANSTKKVGTIQFAAKEAALYVVNKTFFVHGHNLRVTPFQINQVLGNAAAKKPKSPNKPQTQASIVTPAESVGSATGNDVMETLGNANHFTDRCITCKTAQVDCIILWCGHVNVCLHCASQMQNCPVFGCGKEIEKITKLDDR
ncbi:uncharacterized protein LOC129581564 isoform X2 [Paramacrobiotus metropolitanus]|uniref:uncharacterized protein LOC129581564 isoform X2 n=1 Tax=Paramacrobiotus metropolitanus TaxID=2943436 RepID=UPI0024459849|nr:uncharacterized protein LOC129581564 isoform X2 [Paramacrobiotus metropolitanus]